MSKLVSYGDGAPQSKQSAGQRLPGTRLIQAISPMTPRLKIKGGASPRDIGAEAVVRGASTRNRSVHYCFGCKFLVARVERHKRSQEKKKSDLPGEETPLGRHSISM